MKIFAVIMCAGLLGGCWVTDQPSFMPAGYTYHQEAYKSAPERSKEMYKATLNASSVAISAHRDVYTDTRPPSDVYSDMDMRHDMDINSMITPLPMDRSTLRGK